MERRLGRPPHHAAAFASPSATAAPQQGRGGWGSEGGEGKGGGEPREEMGRVAGEAREELEAAALTTRLWRR